jgi:hypothetical protein
MVTPSPGINNYIDVIHGKCGILMASLTDPLSRFINKILGLRDDEINAIGFYYENEVNRSMRHTVILFNTYDNNPIPWLRLGTQMDALLASPFVKRIIFSPISNDTNFSPSEINSTNNRIEQTFRTLVVETIGVNAHTIHDKNLIYTALLMKIVAIDNAEIERISNKIITGYNLVNKVLLNLMGIKNTESPKLSNSLIQCPLLKKSVSIRSVNERCSESDITYVIEESRREITKLIAIFADLYTSHTTFRDSILAMRSTERSNNNLTSLFERENELVSAVVGGLQTGIISNYNLNMIINDLTTERYNLGEYQGLPTIDNPSKNVSVTTDDVPLSFQLPATIHSTDPMRDLGVHINHIADSFDNPEILMVNLGGIIASYNAAIRGSNLPKILIPHIGSDHTVSRQAIVTLPGNDSGHQIEIHINSKSIPIAMYNSNLTGLSEHQLLDTLVYIDSLRSTEGTSDTRYTNLQNEITHELSRRRRNKSTQN